MPSPLIYAFQKESSQYVFILRGGSRIFEKDIPVHKGEKKGETYLSKKRRRITHFLRSMRIGREVETPHFQQRELRLFIYICLFT